MGGVEAITHSMPIPAGTDPALGARQDAFLDLLARARRTSGGAAGARKAAEELVAITFVEPVLKMLRETSQAAPPFAPGEGEREFGALRDAEFARQIVRAAHFPLVDRLARDLRRGVA